MITDYMEIRIHAKKLLWVLVVFLIVLNLANLFALALRYYWDYPYAAGIVPLFDINGEDNFPSTYSTIILFLCAGLLAMIGAAKRERQHRFAVHWLVLSIIFVYLGIDESISIHEHISYRLSASWDGDKPLYFAWILPYGLLLLLLAWKYWKFLNHLRPQIKRLFIVAGSVFLLGAIGFEMLSGLIAMQYEPENLWYAALGSVEELMEMTGIVIFIYALCLQLAMEDAKLTISIDRPEK